MAAIFPLDTTQPWTFNGVTYEYDATEDRWFVVSTGATDSVVKGINSNQNDIDVLNTLIDQEIQNRNDLLDVAAAKNNQQDAQIAELDTRVDALASSSGKLEFRGNYTYVSLKTTAGCQAEYEQCLRDAQDADDVNAARSQCSREFTECTNSIGEPLADTQFSTTGTDDVGGPSLQFEQQESITISSVSIEGSSFDWHNVLEIGDFIELVETTDKDIILYEVISDPITKNGSEEIRIKYIKSDNLGNGQFDYNEVYTIRAFRAKQGLDIITADERYIKKPYSVYFEDNAADITPISPDGELKNGELWYDTDSLELFIYNNNAWTASARPPTADITIKGVIDDVDTLTQEAFITNQRLNTLISESLLENNIYYSDNAPTGDVTGTLRNGDIWIDSDDLTIKFYSGGAWINPDRQAGGNYLEKTGGEMTGKLTLGRVGNEIDGFTVQGRKQNGTVGNLLSVYHNGNNTIPDAVNYFGKVDSDNNIQTKKSVTDLIGSTLINAFTYQAANGITSGADWQNPANDGKFSAGNNLSSDNHFWYFSDIDQNGNLLNLRRFSSSDKETLYIQIGHYSHTYLSDPDVNRDGMKIVWAGLVEQVNRVKTGSAGSAVFYPGWELFLNRGTGDNPIPGGTITNGGTYYIKIGGLL